MKSITINTKTWEVAITHPDEVRQDCLVIITHKEILAQLPALIKNDSVADAVKDIALIVIKKLTAIELPMVGVGKFSIGVSEEQIVSNVLAKEILLSRIADGVLPPRIIRVLEKQGIYTVYTLAILKPSLGSLGNLGEVSKRCIADFLSVNGITDTVIKKLQDQNASISAMPCNAFPELVNNPMFKVLLDATASIEDIRLWALGTFSGNDHPRYKMFPQRYEHNRDYIKTPYEKKFSKEQRDEINEWLMIIIAIAEECHFREIKKFIEEM